MDYALENLGPERFQELCQALLVAEMSHVQCFPVAQPDGGRDAISYPSEGEFVVFQVKYNRRPNAERDPHKWLLKALEDDVAKVARLIPGGAKEYVVITNVPGTAHLDTGSIDRAAAFLSDSLDVPSRVCWRDDINRRLDGNLDLRWSYADIVSGLDALGILLTSGTSEADKRRDATVRAFLIAQYQADQQLRFKQIELESSLLEFFVDVPASVARRAPTRQADHIQWSLIQKVLSTTETPPYVTVDVDDLGTYRHMPPAVGAARVLARCRRPGSIVARRA